jgi:hypothetical protein
MCWKTSNISRKCSAISFGINIAFLGEFATKNGKTGPAISVCTPGSMSTMTVALGGSSLNLVLMTR